MRKDVKEKFRAYILAEADRVGEKVDPVRVVMRIAAYSDDTRAQLMSIRMLKRELAADDAYSSGRWDGRWNVIVEDPDGTRTVRPPRGSTKFLKNPAPEADAA